MNSPITNLAMMINQQRASVGRSMLTYDAGLAAAAQLQTNDMVSQNYFAMVSPQGIDPFTRYVSSTFTPRAFTAGQYFIAQGTTDPNTLFNSLTQNPATLAVMDSPTWAYVGIGYNPGNGGTWLLFFSN